MRGGGFGSINAEQNVFGTLIGLPAALREAPECSDKADHMGIIGFVVPALSVVSRGIPQNAQRQQRVTEIKESAALNKQALAQYTWQEQQTISIKGEVKKQK